MKALKLKIVQLIGVFIILLGQKVTSQITSDFYIDVEYTFVYGVSSNPSVKDPDTKYFHDFRIGNATDPTTEYKDLDIDCKWKSGSVKKGFVLSNSIDAAIYFYDDVDGCWQYMKNSDGSKFEITAPNPGYLECTQKSTDDQPYCWTIFIGTMCVQQYWNDNVTIKTNI